MYYHYWFGIGIFGIFGIGNIVYNNYNNFCVDTMIYNLYRYETYIGQKLGKLLKPNYKLENKYHNYKDSVLDINAQTLILVNNKCNSITKSNISFMLIDICLKCKRSDIIVTTAINLTDTLKNTTFYVTGNKFNYSFFEWFLKIYTNVDIDQYTIENISILDHQFKYINVTKNDQNISIDTNKYTIDQNE